VVFCSPENELAIIIESKELSEALQKLFHGLKLLGKKIDPNAEIRKHLASK